MDNLAPLVEFWSLASVVKTTERVNLSGWTVRRLDGEASRDGGTPIQSNQRELLCICLWSGLMTHHCGFHELFESRCMRCDVGKTNKLKNVHIGWFMDSVKWDLFGSGSVHVCVFVFTFICSLMLAWICVIINTVIGSVPTVWCYHCCLKPHQPCFWASAGFFYRRGGGWGGLSVWVLFGQHINCEGHHTGTVSTG